MAALLVLCQVTFALLNLFYRKRAQSDSFAAAVSSHVAMIVPTLPFGVLSAGVGGAARMDDLE
jgi:hypothetical protein